MPETRSKLYQVTWPVTPVIRATLCSLIVDSYFLLANITQLLLNNNFANFVSIVQYNKSTFSVPQFYLYTCNNVNMHTFCFQYASCFLHKLLIENILLAKKNNLHCSTYKYSNFPLYQLSQYTATQFDAEDKHVFIYLKCKRVECLIDKLSTDLLQVLSDNDRMLQIDTIHQCIYIIYSCLLPNNIIAYLKYHIQ